MNTFNGFTVLKKLTGSITQWLEIIGAGVFLVKTIIHFSWVNLLLTALFAASIPLTIMLCIAFTLCAMGREIQINEEHAQHIREFTLK